MLLTRENPTDLSLAEVFIFFFLFSIAVNVNILLISGVQDSG